MSRAMHQAGAVWLAVVVASGILGVLPPCRAAGDFNGDGKDDIISFVRDSGSGDGRGDVFVALSTGTRFSGTGSRWHEFFCVGNEIPAVGDFNGDGKSDIVTFIRNTAGDPVRGDVIVALSTGSAFGTAYKWHESFARGERVPAVGDVNGDGKDDIIAFVRDSESEPARGDVWVALSTGSGFGAAQKWHDFFCISTEIPAVGDVNGDGKADIISFARDTWAGDGRGDVYVALSTGSAFSGTGVKWHDFFCIANEIPVVGDVNGDGKADIATFVREESPSPARADVYVALSTGTGFAGTAVQWHSFFGLVNFVPDVGDFNGDGRDDVANFLHESHTDARRADVEVALSSGSAFGNAATWHDFFCIRDEVATTFSAVFPYYMFSTTFENTSSRCGGYVSDQETRFMSYVWGFKHAFEPFVPCSQYFWGDPGMLNEDHLDFVDAVDIAYVAGHGNVSYIELVGAAGCDLKQCSWGSWSSNTRKGDLEYIMFESCQVASLEGQWWNRWMATPNRKGPFSGLHVAGGFWNNHWWGPDFDMGAEFAVNMAAGYSVRYAWLEAADDENDYVSGHFNIPSAIYLVPHKDEIFAQHGSADRWYHSPDYIMEAQYIRE